MLFTWDIALETVPKYLNINSLDKTIKSACKYVEKTCQNQVSFKRDSQNNIIFGFEDFGPNDTSNGNWELIKPNKYAVAFNTQYKWGTLYQFWRPMSVRMLVIHELGHILGLGHTNDTRSVMYLHPYLPYFNDHEKAQLIYLTNPNRKK